MIATLFPFFFVILLVYGMHVTWPLKNKNENN